MQIKVTQMKSFIFSFLFLFSFQINFAQEVVISGRVISGEDNHPLEGVSIQINNSNKATRTDNDGRFKITAGLKDILKITSIGFEDQTIPIANKKDLNIKLKGSAVALNEVTVVGYGTQKKVNLTGAVQSVKIDDIKNTPVTNASQLMYGRFSGVQLTQNNGLAGADASSITIRGLGTFGNSVPLIVIDGMQFDGLAEFNRLSPSDIETITVLKDASAGAIYGARGANGVIVVTTKQGKRGDFKVEYNSYIGFQNPTVIPDLLDAVKYSELLNERFKNAADGLPFFPRYTNQQLQEIKDGTNPDQFANTDWADEILQKAPIQNHFLSLSGGSDKTTYRLSFGYLKQDAIVKGKFKSDVFNFSANLNSKLKEWLTVGNNLKSSYTKFTGPSGGPATATFMIGNLGLPPTIPVHYSNGDFAIIDGSYYNLQNALPSAKFNLVELGVLGDYKSSNYNINNRFNITIEPIKKLTFESAFTVNLYFDDNSDFMPDNEHRDWNNKLVTTSGYNTLNKSTSKRYRLLNDNLLRYSNVFNKSHNVSFLLGHSVMYDNNAEFNGVLQNFPSNSLQQFNAGGVSNPSVSGGASENVLQSFFGRFNYSYKTRYLFEANLRRDGSSKFGPDNRYSTFPSLSAGWRISEEPFMHNLLPGNIINSLKVRASWGRTGNNGIDNYIYDQTYNSGLDYFLGDAIVSGIALTNLANPLIKWETTEQYDIGFDASFFNNRLTVEADYFNRKSYDVLYTNFPVPATLGVTTLSAQNSAEVLNKGFEFNLNYQQKVNKFNYNIGVNFTKMALNKVTSLGSGIQTIDNQDIIMIGEPFRAYYGVKAIGIFQTKDEVMKSPAQFGDLRIAPGDLKYEDISGSAGKPDGKIDAFDRVVIGSPYPEWLYGLNASMSFKGFDVGLSFQGIGNVDRYIRNSSTQGFINGYDNVLGLWLNRWTPDNTNSNLYRIGGAKNEQFSSFQLVDASYVRLKNVELGYSIPRSLTKNKITEFRIYVAGQNMVTFTKMKDYDPERSGNNYSANSVPLYKVFTFGVNVVF